MNTTAHITLCQLQQMVRRGIEAALPHPVWVCAELSDIKVNRSGHCYLELVEKGESDSIPRAKASAAIWKARYEVIRAHFLTSTGSDLAVGMKVLLRVTASYHELYGFSLVVSDIDPTYTLGDMQARIRQTIEALKADGIWDMNRECDMPMVCQRLAVVSSATAAGYQDFCRQLAGYGYGFAVTLFEAVVQGFGAEESIITALEAIAEREEEFDAVVIIRGGGSTSDLACFNSYAVCSCIAQFPLPVVTGIGHDKDQSVADFVAHTSLKTPTAVADFFGGQAERLDARLDELGERLAAGCEALLAARRQHLMVLGHATSEGCLRVARGVELRLQMMGERISLLSSQMLKRCAEQTEQKAAQLGEGTSRLIEQSTTRLRSLGEVVAAHSPERVLAHGFSIVRVGGKALSSVERAEIGGTAEVSLSDGTLNVKITDICKKS